MPDGFERFSQTREPTYIGQTIAQPSTKHIALVMLVAFVITLAGVYTITHNALPLYKSMQSASDHLLFSWYAALGLIATTFGVLFLPIILFFAGYNSYK